MGMVLGQQVLGDPADVTSPVSSIKDVGARIFVVSFSLPFYLFGPKIFLSSLSGVVKQAPNRPTPFCNANSQLWGIKVNRCLKETDP